MPMKAPCPSEEGPSARGAQSKGRGAFPPRKPCRAAICAVAPLRSNKPHQHPYGVALAGQGDHDEIRRRGRLHRPCDTRLPASRSWLSCPSGVRGREVLPSSCSTGRFEAEHGWRCCRQVACSPPPAGSPCTRASPHQGRSQPAGRQNAGGACDAGRCDDRYWIPRSSVSGEHGDVACWPPDGRDSAGRGTEVETGER